MVAVLTPCSKKSSVAGTSREQDGFDLFADSTPLGYVGGDAEFVSLRRQ